MSELSMLDKIQALMAAEAARGNGLVGLWLNWNGYRDHPSLFTPELNALTRRTQREDVATILNTRWNEHGIATVVHRGGTIRSDLVTDRTAWLREELSSRASRPDLARFTHSLTTNGPTRGHAVVVLADQCFAYDGQSLLEWHHGGHVFRTTILDADEVLPSGLTSLLGYDSEMQEWVSQLEYNLVERWIMREADNASAAKQSLNELCQTVTKQHEPARARRLAGLPDSGNRNSLLDNEELNAIRQRIHFDLTTRVAIIKEKRLADKNSGLLNWFLPRDGNATLKGGELLLRCFGNPMIQQLSPDSWAVALANDATPQERQQLNDNPSLKVAVLTLVSLYCAMRFGNIFAHRGEYNFDLPQYMLEGMLKNELRNLQRMASAWSP